MEGYMNKWTNYISGWKPRYFMLSQGILSYYLSCEEVGAGCRGSVRVIHCRTISHPYDHCRLDIALPSKRYIYLKASTPSERQQWLVALANAKMETEGKKREIGASLWVDKNVDVKRLKEKRNELDSGRQQLLRQISALKNEIETITKSNTDELKRVQSLSLLISSTCDTILATFDECVSITGTMLSESADGSEPLGTLHSTSPSDSPFLPRLPAPRAMGSQPSTPHEVIEKTFPSPPSYLHPISSFTLVDFSPTPSCYEPCVSHIEGSLSPLDTVSPVRAEVTTLLTPICKVIASVVIPSQPDLIQMKPFIESCRLFPDFVVQVFGRVYAPLARDIKGNINKIEMKHDLLHRESETLNKLILTEIERDEHTDDKSATTGLLWLKRTIHLVQKSFSGIAIDNLSPNEAAVIAYQVSLMPYQNWFMRSLSPFILKQTDNMMNTICMNDLSREEAARVQMKFISQEMLKLLTIVDNLYIANNLM